MNFIHLSSLVRNCRGLIPLLLLLCIWQFLSNGPSPFFPAPSYWFLEISQLWKNGQLQNSFKQTLWVFGFGLSLSIVIGLLLGVFIGINQTFKQWTTYCFECLRAIPPPVIIPIAVLFMGYSDSMKVLVIVLATIWPILLNVVSGIHHMPTGLLDMSKAIQLSKQQFIFKVLLPAILPNAITGIRVTIPLAIILTLLTEMLTGSVGLGGIMIAAQRNYNAAQVFGVLIIVGLLGLVVNLISHFLEKQFTKNWPPKKK